MKPRTTMTHSMPEGQPQPLTDLEREQRGRQRRAMIQTIVLFIVGLSVILSYEWWRDPPVFAPNAPGIIFGGVMVAAIVYFVMRYTIVFTVSCPDRHRRIPADAFLCPYCGRTSVSDRRSWRRA
jgi:hypothetical protein